MDGRGLLLLSCLIFVCFSNSGAQTVDTPTIKVDAREVLIPVQVFKHDYDFNGNPENREVLDLAVKEFHVYEDDHEARITGMHLQFWPGWNERDNVGRHCVENDLFYGLWSGVDLPPHSSMTCEPRLSYVYVISIHPEEFAAISCHKLRVKVDRHLVTVHSREEYCDTSSPSDPLEGTRLGQQLQVEIDGETDGGIALGGQVSALLSDGSKNVVHIALDFPGKRFAPRFDGKYAYSIESVGGAIYRKSGSLVARFSDPGPFLWLGAYMSLIPIPDALLRDWLFSESSAHYDREIALDSGDYIVKIAITNGADFGRVELPFTVQADNPHRLTLSSIILCKRFHRTEDAHGEAERRPANYIPLISQAVEFTPTGDTRFSEGERLIVWFQMHTPTSTANPAQVKITVVNLQSGRMEADSGVQNTPIPASTSGYANGITKEIGIDKLSPGSYRIDVQATDPASGTSATSSASFTVVK